MTARTEKRGFATRPADPDGWIKAGDTAPARGAAAVYSARLTIDVTPPCAAASRSPPSAAE